MSTRLTHYTIGWVLTFLALGILVSSRLATEVVAQSSFDLTWHTIDSGGGGMTGGFYTLAGTIGQPDALASSGCAFELSGGFWFGQPGQQCLADIANACESLPDGHVDVFDLIELLDNWNTGGPGAAITAPTDVVDVFDLIGLLDAWGSCP